VSRRYRDGSKPSAFGAGAAWMGLSIAKRIVGAGLWSIILRGITFGARGSRQVFAMIETVT